MQSSVFVLIIGSWRFVLEKLQSTQCYECANPLRCSPRVSLYCKASLRYDMLPLLTVVFSVALLFLTKGASGKIYGVNLGSLLSSIII